VAAYLVLTEDEKISTMCNTTFRHTEVSVKLLLKFRHHLSPVKA